MTSEVVHQRYPFGAKVIEEMSREDCETFLAKTTNVGRVAFCSASGGQQLLPVNFVFRGGRVYFATASDGVVSELAQGCEDVAFEIDYADRMTQHGWSVLVRGQAKALAGGWAEDPGIREPRPWAPGTRDVLIELNPRQITGRRIRNDIPPPK